VRVWLDQESEAWQTLSVLRNPPREIVGGDLLRLRGALVTAQWAESLITLNAGRQVRLSRQLGIADPPPEKTRVEKFCTLNEEAWLQYVRSLELRN